MPPISALPASQIASHLVLKETYSPGGDHTFLQDRAQEYRAKVRRERNKRDILSPVNVLLPTNHTADLDESSLPGGAGGGGPYSVKRIFLEAQNFARGKSGEEPKWRRDKALSGSGC